MHLVYNFQLFCNGCFYKNLLPYNLLRHGFHIFISIDWPHLKQTSVPNLWLVVLPLLHCYTLKYFHSFFLSFVCDLLLLSLVKQVRWDASFCLWFECMKSENTVERGAHPSSLTIMIMIINKIILLAKTKQCIWILIHSQSLELSRTRPGQPDSSRKICVPKKSRHIVHTLHQQHMQQNIFLLLRSWWWWFNRNNNVND